MRYFFSIPTEGSKRPSAGNSSCNRFQKATVAACAVATIAHSDEKPNQPLFLKGCWNVAARNRISFITIQIRCCDICNCMHRPGIQNKYLYWCTCMIAHCYMQAKGFQIVYAQVRVRGWRKQPILLHIHRQSCISIQCEINTGNTKQELERVKFTPILM